MKKPKFALCLILGLFIMGMTAPMASPGFPGGLTVARDAARAEALGHSLDTLTVEVAVELGILDAPPACGFFCYIVKPGSICRRDGFEYPHCACGHPVCGGDCP